MISKIELLQITKNILKILILASFLFDKYSFYYEYSKGGNEQIKHHGNLMKHHMLSIPYLKEFLGHLQNMSNDNNLNKFEFFYYFIVIYDITIFIVNSVLVFSDSYLNCGFSLFDTLLKIFTKINFDFFLRNIALFLNVAFSLLLLFCLLFQTFSNWNLRFSEKESESDISELNANLEMHHKEKRSRKSIRSRKGTPFGRITQLESKF
jgi:hypothetical protein